VAGTIQAEPIAGTPTQALTMVQGGQKFHIEIDETIYHPGHYRIALARTRADHHCADLQITADANKPRGRQQADR
jgi:hypothetical protein